MVVVESLRETSRYVPVPGYGNRSYVVYRSKWLLKCGLQAAIESSYGDFSSFKTKFNAALAGIQGSGWAWLVKDNETGQVQIRTYANQDPVVGKYTPLLGIDAWEHAYYLQYQNRKAEYFSAIWDVINWKTVEQRLK